MDNSPISQATEWDAYRYVSHPGSQNFPRGSATVSCLDNVPSHICPPLPVSLPYSSTWGYLPNNLLACKSASGVWLYYFVFIPPLVVGGQRWCPYHSRRGNRSAPVPRRLTMRGRGGYRLRDAGHEGSKSRCVRHSLSVLAEADTLHQHLLRSKPLGLQFLRAVLTGQTLPSPRQKID